MTTDYICHIIKATVTYFGIDMIEDLMIFMTSTKILSNKSKHCFAILVLVFLLNVELYQMMFLPLFLLSYVYCFFSNKRFSEYLHLSKMLLYNGAAALKTYSLQEFDKIPFEADFGISFCKMPGDLILH